MAGCIISRSHFGARYFISPHGLQTAIYNLLSLSLDLSFKHILLWVFLIHLNHPLGSRRKPFDFHRKKTAGIYPERRKPGLVSLGFFQHPSVIRAEAVKKRLLRPVLGRQLCKRLRGFDSLLKALGGVTVTQKPDIEPLGPSTSPV